MTKLLQKVRHPSFFSKDCVFTVITSDITEEYVKQPRPCGKRNIDQYPG